MKSTYELETGQYQCHNSVRATDLVHYIIDDIRIYKSDSSFANDSANITIA